AIRGAARAAARLVIGHAGARARIVGLLRLPGDQPAFHIDLPAARAGAVHPVRRAHDLVVLPALPVAFFPAAVLVPQLAMTVGERLAQPGQVGETLEKMAHAVFLVRVNRERRSARPLLE